MAWLAGLCDLTAGGERKIHLQSSICYEKEGKTIPDFYPCFTSPKNPHHHTISCGDSQPSANALHSCCLLSFSLCEHFFPFIPFLSAIVSPTILWALPTTSSSPCCQIQQDQNRSHAEKPTALSVVLVHGTGSPGSCSSSTGWFSDFSDTWSKTFLAYQVPWTIKLWIEIIL